MTKLVMNRKEPVFDIFYDFRNDSGGKEPDIASLTLRHYHRLSKNLTRKPPLLQVEG